MLYSHHDTAGPSAEIDDTMLITLVDFHISLDRSYKRFIYYYFCTCNY